MANEKEKEVKKVAVEISHRCLVDGIEREAGDIVLMDEKTADGEPFAKLFGTVMRGKAAIEEATEAKEDEVQIQEKK